MYKPQLVFCKASVRLAQLAAGAGLKFPVLAAPGQLAAGARLVWKSIESVGQLGLVLDALPDSRAILLIRNACVYIASVLPGDRQLQFEHNRGASEDYGVLEQLLATELAQEKKFGLELFRDLQPEERLAMARYPVRSILKRMSAENCEVASATICPQTFTTLYPSKIIPHHGILVEQRLRHLLSDDRATI